MRSYINHRLRCVELWLTHDEGYPAEEIITALRVQHPGYRVVTFRSGTQDLTSATMALLNNNLV